MCGGLSSALGLNTDNKRLIVGYHLGRLSSYSFAGVLIGFAGYWLAEHFQALLVLRLLAALMLILLGLYLTGLLNLLIITERIGAVVWRKLQPLGKRYLRPQTGRQAFLLGTIWGWLPCGLVYSALIYASAQANTGLAALTMFCFGLGTLPSMLGASLAGQHATRFFQNTWVKKLSGGALLVYGIWSVVQLSHAY